MSREIGASLVRRNLQSVSNERMPVLQHNVNDPIDARGVYFNFGALKIERRLLSLTFLQ